MKVDFGTFYLSIVTAVIVTYAITKFGIKGIFDIDSKPANWIKKIKAAIFE